MVTLEGSRAVDVHVERRADRGLAGSVFKGRVTRVLAGIQAAFVDIGLEKSAFLPAADYRDADGAGAANAADESVPIEQRLQAGREIVVQIGKEPIGSKGARVTSHIALPGRMLVYCPFGDRVTISRRIEDEGERSRLLAIAESLLPETGGLIVRTACDGASQSELASDLALLQELWRRALDKKRREDGPVLLHRDLDLVLRSVRDMPVGVDKIVIDRDADHARVVDLLDAVVPPPHPAVVLYDLPEPLFQRYGVEGQIERALEARVGLPSGGSIVIDTTEALTSIDVNSGGSVGQPGQRDTALQTNLEAARVIAEQLRLRDIGGVIVVDFIDLEDPADRETVLAELDRALQEQRTRAEVHGFSELGLVELTRHRKRENLRQRLCEPCPHCTGTGYVKSTATLAYQLLRTIRREGRAAGSRRRIEVALPSAVAAFLAEQEPTAIAELADELGLAIELRESGDPTKIAVVVPPDPDRVLAPELAALPDCD